jgi:hypothetical protein
MKSGWIAMFWLAAGSQMFGYQAAPRAPMAPPAQVHVPGQTPGQMPAQTPAVAPVPGAGSIEGQVLNLKTGTPLKKANVRLVGINSGQGVMPTMNSKETDDQGHFVFTGLPAGRYQLSAERQGFLRQSYGGHKYSGNGTPLVLGQDQHVKDVLFKLNPQAVIVGKVLDEDGEPVANVQVRALKYVYRSGKKQWSPVANGNSSDIGEFRIPNLEPGRYLVSTNSRNAGMNFMQTASNDPLPDTPEMTYASTYYPSTRDATTAVPVDVGPGGEVRGIDIRLVKTRVFRIRGKVVVPSGVRANQVMVMLTPKDGGMAMQNMSPARGPDNRFEIRNVAPGSYIAHAQFGGGQSQYMASQPVEVANHVEGMVLTLAGGSDVPGSIKLEDATTTVDLQKISVNLRPTGFMNGGAPRSKVGEDLKFTFKNVAPLSFAINVGGIPDNCYVKSIRYGGQEVPDSGVEMTSGGPIEITLSATAAQVDGVVMDKDGKPSPGALVALIPQDGSRASGRSADENGIVSFKGLRPGDYKILAFEDIEPGAYMDPDFVKPFESRAKSVKLDANGHEAVQLKVVPAADTDKN